MYPPTLMIPAFEWGGYWSVLEQDPCPGSSPVWDRFLDSHFLVACAMMISHHCAAGGPTSHLLFKYIDVHIRTSQLSSSRAYRNLSLE